MNRQSSILKTCSSFLKIKLNRYEINSPVDPFENDQVSLARTLTLLEQEIKSKNILDSNFPRIKIASLKNS